MRDRATARRGRERVDLVVVVACVVVGAALSNLNPASEFAVIRVLRSTVLAPFIGLHEAFDERARLTARLAELRTEHERLVAEVLRLRAAAVSGQEARRLLRLESIELGDMVVADVAPGRSWIGASDVFLLRGQALERVTPPSGVMTAEGLVGVLRSVDRREGRGEFWTHPDFRVSVKTEDERVTGIVRSTEVQGGQRTMLLEGAPYQGDVLPGTVLYTTGLGGIYPPGVRVGTVMAVSEVESGWAKSYFVRPAVRPEEVGLALVWRAPRTGS